MSYPYPGLLLTEPLALWQATADPYLCRRHSNTQSRSDLVSVGSPGAHKGLFVPSQSLFPQSCVSSSGSMVGLMATSSKRAYAIPRTAASRALAPVAGHC